MTLAPQLGDSLLVVVPESGAVRCPGCCATAPTSAVLVHEDGCAVRRQIETAVFLFQILDADGDEPIVRHG